MRVYVLLALACWGRGELRADSAWTTNGTHCGVLTLAPVKAGDALDGPGVKGGRGWMGSGTLSYSLWLLEGEPAHDFIFSWDWRLGNFEIARSDGRVITVKELAKYPDLERTFRAIRPISVTLETVIEFFGRNGERLGVGRKRISLGSLEHAGATNMLHLPGSPRWADFFEFEHADNPSRDELDRRNKALFTKAARVKLSAPRLVAVDWPESVIDACVAQFEQREPHPKLPPASAPLPALTAAPAPGVQSPNPLELAFRAAYTGRFCAKDMDLFLRPQAGHWQGTLISHGKRFALTAEPNAQGLKGKFGSGSEEWPFTASLDGERMTLSAGTFSAVLQRQRLTELAGRWQSARVTVTFSRAGGASERTVSGELQFDGAKYTFGTEEKSGELEGLAKGQGTQVLFRLGWGEAGLIARIGEVEQTLAYVQNRSMLRVRAPGAGEWSLFDEGKPVSLQHGVCEFEGDRLLHLEARAQGYYPARTNLWLPGYTELVWAPAWQPRAYAGLGSGPWTNSLGMVLVPVPGTEVLFCACDTRVRDYAAFAGAVTGVDDSWRGAEFQNTSVGREPDEPVTMVSWHEAQAFCEWLTRVERKADVLRSGQFYRLPTDAEWSLAAGLPAEKGEFPRDKDMKVKGIYPWGTTWPPPPRAGNFADRTAAAQFRNLEAIEKYDDGYATTSPVGRFTPNGLGLYDLSGNVWQWCDDWFDARRDKHVLRGGSWRSSEPLVLWSSHRGTAPDVRDVTIGFRCVLVWKGR